MESHGDMEVWRRAGSVAIWRHEGMDASRFRGAL